jgi:hypothetical protein
MRDVEQETILRPVHMPWMRHGDLLLKRVPNDRLSRGVLWPVGKWRRHSVGGRCDEFRLLHRRA